MNSAIGVPIVINIEMMMEVIVNELTMSKSFRYLNVFFRIMYVFLSVAMLEGATTHAFLSKRVMELSRTFRDTFITE